MREECPQKTGEGVRRRPNQCSWTRSVIGGRLAINDQRSRSILIDESQWAHAHNQLSIWTLRRGDKIDHCIPFRRGRGLIVRIVERSLTADRRFYLYNI